MSKKTEALIRFAIAAGAEPRVIPYTGKTIPEIFKQFGVNVGAIRSVDEICSNKTADILNILADKMSPTPPTGKYDLVIKSDTIKVNVTRNLEPVTPGTGELNEGDVLEISFTAPEDYVIESATLNGEDIVSGATHTVTGNVNIVIIGHTIVVPVYDLSRTATNCAIEVTKDGQAVADGTAVLNNNDVITITATPSDGFEMQSLTVNGEDFTSGDTYRVTGNVAIVGTVEQSEEPEE